MSTFKKCKVVMLPTNEKANLYLHKTKGLHLLAAVEHKSGSYSGSNQHLYFLSDEEIKEGDWFVGFADGSISPFVKQADESTVEINDWQLNRKGTSSNKKIIATTDKSLFINEFIGYTYTGGKSAAFSHKNLPQPSDSFIQKYVSEYNKGNVITEVLVEYEDKVAMDGHTIIGSELKISKDNTITIRKVKDSWNRDEVIELAKRYAKRCQAPMTDSKWFEENL